MTLKDRDFRFGDHVRHFKGGTYRIVCTARHTETGETLVLYVATGEHAEKVGAGIWARPEDMFCSAVDREEYPDSEQTYRMERVKEDNDE